VDERQKVELVDRTFAAWNRGDIDSVLEQCTEDFEWDLTGSDVPGESRVQRGHEEFRAFAGRWREALGPTQSRMDGFRELDDGRLFARVQTVGTGTRSGVDVAQPYFQIVSFEGSKASRYEIFTDPNKARAAAGGAELELRAPEESVERA